MYKLKFYSKSIFEHFFIPDIRYRKRLSTIFSKTNDDEIKQALKRVNYYFKREDFFDLNDENSNTLSSLSCFNKSAYYYDIRSVLRYFPHEFKFNCWLRDVITVPDQPCFVKCRPIAENHENSAILKLNQVRHFRKIKDAYKYEEKLDKLVWRGSVHQRTWRSEFVKKLFNNSRCDVGALSGTAGIAGSQFEKRFLSINEQLRNKFIFSIEGADVATNLKWIAQSNSLCFMKKPRHESWFMENSLVPGFHYVLVDESLDDINDKIKFYQDNPDKAEAIISNLQKFYSQFEDTSSEVLVSLLVVLKYFYLSGQLSLERFGFGFLESDFLGSN